MYIPGGYFVIWRVGVWNSECACRTHNKQCSAACAALTWTKYPINYQYCCHLLYFSVCISISVMFCELILCVNANTLLWTKKPIYKRKLSQARLLENPASMTKHLKRFDVSRSQMISKCSNNKKVASKAITKSVTDVLTTF